MIAGVRAWSLPLALLLVQHAALGQKLRDHALLLCFLQGRNGGLFGIDGGAVRSRGKNVPHKGLAVPSDVLPIGGQRLQKRWLQLFPLGSLLGTQFQVVLQIQVLRLRWNVRRSRR